MSTHSRPDRVGQEIQAAIADLLSRGMLRDPRIGFRPATARVRLRWDARLCQSASRTPETLETLSVAFSVTRFSLC